MPAFNPYSVMESFDQFGGNELGMKRPMRQLSMPIGKPPLTNPYSFTGQDQYGTFQGGGDMPNIAPNQNQLALKSNQPVGVQNPTQSISNNPYASMFPTFNANDLRFQNEYDHVGDMAIPGTQPRPLAGRGSLSNVGNYYQGQTELNPNNYFFRQVYGNRDVGNGYTTNDFIDPNAMELMVKTGEKEGTVIPYSLQNGQWIPNYEGRRTQAWDTNPGDQNRALAMIAAAAVASPFITQALGAGAGAGGFTGFLGEGVASGIPAWDAAAGLGGAGLGGGGLGVGELMGPPDFLAGSNVDPYGVGSGFGGDTLPAMGVPNDTGAGLLDRLTGLGSRVGNLGSSVGRLLGGAGGVGGASGGGGGGSGLAGLIAALYGSNAQENYADQLNQFIQEMRSNANPYMTRLQESYTNPQAYLESPEMQARLGIEANKLTGIDASKGRLSNDIQRTKLLQDYGMSALNDYRTGLRNTVQNLWNPNQVFQAQAMMGAIDSAKYSDIARLLGQGTQGGFSVGNTVNDIKSIIDAGGDLWDFIKDWF